MTRLRTAPQFDLDMRGALVAIVVTLVAWQMVSRAVSSVLVSIDQPDVAIAVRPSDERALASLSSLIIMRRADRKAISSQARTANAQAAEMLARRALASGPLDTVALRLLAQSAEILNAPRRAEDLMKVVGAQTIRNDVADLYLLNLFAEGKDYHRALYYADALLRISPSLAPDVYRTLDKMAAEPDAEPALTAMLAGAPPWRAAYLGSVATQSTDPTSFLAVLAALKSGPHPLEGNELRAYLDPLIARGLVEQAYYAWLQFLPAKRVENLKPVYNGEFAYPLTNLPFDWTVIPINGALVEFAQAPDKDGQALSVQFDGTRVPFRNVVQMLLLPPGRYRLSGSYLANDLNTPRGMTWRLYCAQRNDSKPIAETPLIRGTSGGWKQFDTEFDVPRDKCGAQWLRLELAARVAIEEAVSGSVWYDDIEIVKTDGSAVRPTSSAITMPGRPGSKFERAIRGD